MVIDCDEEALAQAHAYGCMVLQGDATRDATLQAVHVERARALLVTAGRDDTSILVCLTARHLAPELPHHRRRSAPATTSFPARAAGATTVINPVSFAGLLMAGSAQGRGSSDYLADLASAHGRVQLRERKVGAKEVGQPLAAITPGLACASCAATRRSASRIPAPAPSAPATASSS